MLTKCLVVLLPCERLFQFANTVSTGAAPRVPKRDSSPSTITLNGPTGNGGQTFEQTPEPDCAVIVQAPNAHSNSHRIRQNRRNGMHGVDYNSVNDEFCKAGIKAGELYHIPIAEQIQVNAYSCNGEDSELDYTISTFNAAVYGWDGHAAFHGSRNLAIDFTVDNLLKVITASLARTS
ncbi:hypothetical protein DFH07DRAFT_776471 [Mycena maculata]|uniref:Uncharacterized protein n=1 Tax=Mycena maculata TaxID=230809 RepID=A0AAD7IM10_9AGAR|nr:hypothetical protein DFH07DRAFT_776471 [Mycena maculata]